MPEVGPSLPPVVAAIASGWRDQRLMMNKPQIATPMAIMIAPTRSNRCAQAPSSSLFGWPCVAAGTGVGGGGDSLGV